MQTKGESAQKKRKVSENEPDSKFPSYNPTPDRLRQKPKVHFRRQVVNLSPVDENILDSHFLPTEPTRHAPSQVSLQYNPSETSYHTRYTESLPSTVEIGQVSGPSSGTANQAVPIANSSQAENMSNRQRTHSSERNFNTQEQGYSAQDMFHSNARVEPPLSQRSFSSNYQSQSLGSLTRPNDYNPYTRNERINRDFPNLPMEAPQASIHQNPNFTYPFQQTLTNQAPLQQSFMNNSNMGFNPPQVRQQFLRRLKSIPKFDGTTHKELIDFIYLVYFRYLVQFMHESV